MEQPVKRICLIKPPPSQELIDLKNSFELRLTSLESKMDFLVSGLTGVLSKLDKLLSEKNEYCVCKSLVPKLDNLEELIQSQGCADPLNQSESSSGPMFFFQPKEEDSDSNKGDAGFPIIRLKTEEDIPNGSWLGDENNPKARVRVNIPPVLLLHINEHSLTPEKMALNLLDCLFPREVLAVSNLSGKSRNFKKQLDPLLIFGIHCHLVYKFNISEKDWRRIKQNIDSKCRTVWRKKVRGQPLGRSKASTMLSGHVSEESSEETASVINVNPLKVVRANGEQLFQIKDGQTIKVFTDEEIKDLLPTSMGLFSIEDGFNLSDETLIITENSSEKVDDDDSICINK